MKVEIKLKERKTGEESNPVSIENVIFDQSEIEFDFWNEDKTSCNTVPYNYFLLNQDDYEVIVKIKDEQRCNYDWFFIQK